MVIGIISVLIGITVTSVSGSLQQARAQRASALCTLVEQGIETYYAQKDEWPVTPGSGLDKDGHYVYSAEEVRTMVKTVVEQSKEKNPMMDVAGLYVANQNVTNGEPGRKGGGTDFMNAVLGTKRNPEGIRLASMCFGYPRVKDGAFRRFVIKYLPQSDSILVRQFTSKEESAGRVYPESEK